MERQQQFQRLLNNNSPTDAAVDEPRENIWSRINKVLGKGIRLYDEGIEAIGTKVEKASIAALKAFFGNLLKFNASEQKPEKENK